MMKKSILSIVAIMALLSLSSYKTAEPDPNNEQGKRTIYCGIAFYNQENLFDTIHDEGKNDYDFLPTGSFQWNEMKYSHKLHNMAKVLSELCTERVKGGAAFIGMSEVENQNVLKDLLAQPELANIGMEGILVEGPDRRGIDLACIYNPKLFKVKKHELIPPKGYEEFSGGYTTRGILHVEGNLLGEYFHFMVNHWPSRGADSPSREFMGRLCREIVDSIQSVDPEARIVIMGDLNDDPDNASVITALGAKNKMKKVGDQDLFNPWHETLRKKGQGTLLYDNMWNLFDQIIITGNMVGKDRSTFKFFKNEIYMPDYLITKEGKYKGSPKRTTAGGQWQDGYSDHFPTQIYLVKEL